MPEPTLPIGAEARRERTESARLDNFVDGAFAFAITLLIISGGGGLPRSVEDLEHALRGIPAFAVCFLQLAWFWHAHVRWRDAVRLTDAVSLRLSLLLVLFALIFVFPLHLVYAGLANEISRGVLSPEVTIFTTDHHGATALFICYGLSYACMAGTLAALYRHGARIAAWMSREEVISVRVWGVIWAYVAIVGLFSTLLALTLPVQLIGFSGASYGLLGFISLVAHFYRKHLQARLPP
ncbi:MAG: TMEM175 family protein [Rhodanobacteraceae bacterium]